MHRANPYMFHDHTICACRHRYSTSIDYEKSPNRIYLIAYHKDASKKTIKTVLVVSYYFLIKSLNPMHAILDGNDEKLFPSKIRAASMLQSIPKRAEDWS